MPSIVKVPRYDVYDDYDFIGFSFNGYHCVEDLHIIRVSDGSRYKENLTPQIQEYTGQHAGIDGAFLTGVQHRQKTFDIQFAFDGLTQEQIWDIQWAFLGDDIHDLWFDEYPYKVWDAKVTGQPQLQVIPFDNGSGGILYKGEGTVQFTAYYPYAHTPDYVRWPDDKDEDKLWEGRDGRVFSSYYDVNTKQGFKNAVQWQEAANLWSSKAVKDLDVRGEVSTFINIKRANTMLNFKNFKGKWTQDNNMLTYTCSYPSFYAIKYAGIQEKNSPIETVFCRIGQWIESFSSSSYKIAFQTLQQSSATYEEDGIKYTTTTFSCEITKGTPYSLRICLAPVNDFDNPDSSDNFYFYKDTEDFLSLYIPVNYLYITNSHSKILECYLNTDDVVELLNLNSRTGLVSAKVSNLIKPIYYEGRVRVDLEPGTYSIYGFLPSEASYHFWYY